MVKDFSSLSLFAPFLSVPISCSYILFIFIVFSLSLSHLEVDGSTFVSIECPEDVLAKLVGIASRKEHLVHLAECVWSQLSIRTVLGHIGQHCT